MHQRLNLLEETLSVIAKNGKDHRSVRWVGSKDGTFAISWEDFKVLARDIYYYPVPNYGISIAADLIIAGFGWWLERVCYSDGEQWEYRESPKQRTDPVPFSRIVSDLTHTDKTGSYTLKDLNRERKYGESNQHIATKENIISLD
jgi:hypothetical protein